MPAITRKVLANAIRALSMDAVQKANSGHPGMPMGMADIAEVVWNDFLNHNPKNPHWFNRDRFILSNGHGAMLHYSLLHLTGYDLSIEDLKNFRQLHSKTPGHPEFGETPGVETTTGPLGQGIANGVGMALAENILANTFNKADAKIIDHWTYVFLGDGCLMEGVSHEACSLAGSLGLGKLIAFWDDNGISIDGSIETWYADDTGKRFEAYGWHVIRQVDGHNSESIKQAILEAKSITDKPTLICCKTVIGFGAPTKAGKESCHGAPLGEEEILGAKANLNWEYAPFEIPDEIYQAWDATAKGAKAEEDWEQCFKVYAKKYPELAQAFTSRINGVLPDDWAESMAALLQDTQNAGKSVASRKASFQVLNHIGPMLPSLIGGSADLTGSNLTAWDDSKVIAKGNLSGNYLHYGVREFGMGAIMNGLNLHGGFIPFGGTFLTFLDYMRNSVRMAALMQLQCIFVFTHDSIGLGEDGPTHQPIEHITMLRATPNIHTWRPCDAVETVAAWQAAIEYKGVSALLFSRQTIKHQERSSKILEHIAKGGYILKDCNEHPDLILMSSGSEIELCVAAFEHLTQQGMQVRVVSMPCMDVFDAQDAAYRESVLPSYIHHRIAVEAGCGMSWQKYLGFNGKMIGIEQFGASAPAQEVYKYLGLTVENIISVAEALFEELTVA